MIFALVQIEKIPFNTIVISLLVRLLFANVNELALLTRVFFSNRAAIGECFLCQLSYYLMKDKQASSTKGISLVLESLKIPLNGRSESEPVS